MSEEEIELPEGMDLATAKDVLMEYGTTEEPQIVSADVLEAKDNQIDEFAGVFRDALKETKGLKDETVEAMGVDALAAEFRNEEGEIDVDSLAQIPESETDTLENPDDPEDDTLSADEKSEIKDKLERAERLEGRTPEHVDTLRSEAADMAGVDDYEDIELEAL